MMRGITMVVTFKGHTISGSGDKTDTTSKNKANGKKRKRTGHVISIC